MHYDGSKERKGNSGRIPDAIQHNLYVRNNITLPPSLYNRLMKYCDEHERAKSSAIQIALDDWLSERGY